VAGEERQVSAAHQKETVKSAALLLLALLFLALSAIAAPIWFNPDGTGKIESPCPNPCVASTGQPMCYQDSFSDEGRDPTPEECALIQAAQRRVMCRERCQQDWWDLGRRTEKQIERSVKKCRAACQADFDASTEPRR
jgi:hypothetical protein